jgi:hypothetical protein
MGVDEITGKYSDHLHLGQGVAGSVPQVIPVPVDRGELAMLRGEPLPPEPETAPANANATANATANETAQPLPSKE